METENLYMGVKLTDGEGNVTYLRGTRSFALDTYDMLTQYYVPGSSFPTSGTYTVTAAWYNTDTDEWSDVHFQIDRQDSLKLTVADGMLNFEAIPIDYDVRVENVKILTDLYTNTNFQVSAELVNRGDREFLGEVMAAVINAEDEVVATTAAFNVDIEGGQTQTLDYVTRFTKAPAAGTYYFCYVTSDGEILSEPFEVTMSAISGSTSIALQNLRMSSGERRLRPR